MAACFEPAADMQKTEECVAALPQCFENEKEEKDMVTKINAEEFESMAKESNIAVVDFSATWCGPCRMLAPVLEQVSDQLGDKVDFYNLDVDEAPEVAAAFRVTNIPCLVLLKKGRLVSQSVGLRPADQLVSWISGNL